MLQAVLDVATGTDGDGDLVEALAEILTAIRAQHQVLDEIRSVVERER